jgi:Tol biopolymer transport system component
LDANPVISTNGADEGPPIAAAQDMSLAWSPDGSTLAVAMRGVNNGKLSAIVFSDGGGHMQQRAPLFPVRSAQTGPTSPAYSPDGTQLACTIIQQSDLAHEAAIGIGLTQADGSGPPAIRIQGNVSDPKFSPDGHYLFFLAVRRDGGNDLYRADLTTHNAVRVSDGVGNVTGYDVSPQKAPAPPPANSAGQEGANG